MAFPREILLPSSDKGLILVFANLPGNVTLRIGEKVIKRNGHRMRSIVPH
jgi:hypothetical protein